jgi:hypothetical protein
MYNTEKTRMTTIGKNSYSRIANGKACQQHPEPEFLDEIQTKVFRVFLLAIHIHLYSFALRFFIFLQIHATSYSF